jgi:uncharacterized protein
MKILIDGYNLIFAWGWMPNSDHPTASRQARSRLIQKLSQLIEKELRKNILIVFDVKSALAAKHLKSGADPSGFELLYAHGYPDADTLIEELIQKESAPQNLIVVSSDRRIKTAANRRGAFVVESENFLDEIPSLFHSASNENDEVETKLDAAMFPKVETIDWLAEFGIAKKGAGLESVPDESVDLSNGLGEFKEMDADFDAPPFPQNYGRELLE